MRHSAQLLLLVKVYPVWSDGTATLKEKHQVLHGLEKFHHYCFAKDVNIFTDHKPLVAMISKDVVTLSQQLQHIMLHIHQYSVWIFYKPGPELYLVDWLSCHNDMENKDQEI